ncbi:MAG: hypothetical protein V3T92_02865, partial [Anaerolineae bacterium]
MTEVFMRGSSPTALGVQGVRTAQNGQCDWPSTPYIRIPDQRLTNGDSHMTGSGKTIGIIMIVAGIAIALVAALFFG